MVALCNNQGFPAPTIGRPALHMALSGKPVPPVMERAEVPLDAARIAASAASTR